MLTDSCRQTFSGECRWNGLPNIGGQAAGSRACACPDAKAREDQIIAAALCICPSLKYYRAGHAPPSTPSCLRRPPSPACISVYQFRPSIATNHRRSLAQRAQQHASEHVHGRAPRRKTPVGTLRQAVGELAAAAAAAAAVVAVVPDAEREGVLAAAQVAGAGNERRPRERRRRRRYRRRGRMAITTQTLLLVLHRRRRPPPRPRLNSLSLSGTSCSWSLARGPA